MTLDISTLDFPIVNTLPQFKNELEKASTLIIQAETGAGKSTILPLSLLDKARKEGKKIVMLEPRRLAVKSIASRMADLLKEKTGETVGYSIRFESQKSDNTLLHVVTEGILTNMLVSDPELSEYGYVIFDEFHERSVHADVGLALIKELMQTKRPDLKLIIMSATLNSSSLSKALNATAINSKGRTFPVDIQYIGEEMKEFSASPIIHIIKKALKDHEGDILVFLPGQGEIRELQEELRHLGKNLAVMTLFGQLSWHKQQQAIKLHPEGKRKVVLATSIAETSLTIEGVKVVIDSGLGRYSEYDPSIGLSRLITAPISKDEADQRSGRAGRLSAGTCYRLWSAAQQKYRAEHRTPEILKNDLSPLRLDLYAKGFKEIHSLYWLSPPPLDKLMEAENLLNQLEAVQDGLITPLGLEMRSLPCHPRLAHMLTHELSEQGIHLAVDIAALLEEKDSAYVLFGSDLPARIKQLRELRRENRLPKSLKKINKIADSYRKVLDVSENNDAIDDYEVGFLLSLAYPDRIASAKRGNNAQFQLANGAIAAIGHKDELANESWLAVAAMDARQGLGKIFLAAPLNPKDLSPLLKQETVPYWDYEEDLFEYREELKIGQIILKSEYEDDVEDQKDKELAIIQAIQHHGEDILSQKVEFEHFSQQINALRSMNPSQGWPEMNLKYIKALAPIWVKNLRLPDDKLFEYFHELDLINIAKSLLNQEQLALIEAE